MPTPKKMRVDTTTAPKILEQCILEAEIEPEPKKTIQVVLEKSNSIVTVTPSKGTGSSKERSHIPPAVSLESKPITGKHWQCKICTNIFQTKEDVKNHIEVTHGISKITKVNQNMECVFCT
eukprot:TRINITY_DN28046_c0_g1_i1.p1 TRINITY_DN28046_c0_g1~~TRINITY_DN28046_c0_g1_i1.p1  ORF type:complete len:121 (-),score=24.63 TRINITY_DN28046_c0_g1_i1:92-454(-)